MNMSFKTIIIAKDKYSSLFNVHEYGDEEKTFFNINACQGSVIYNSLRPYLILYCSKLVCLSLTTTITLFLYYQLIWVEPPMGLHLGSLQPY